MVGPAPAEPESYVPRFASDHALSDEAECHAHELLATANEGNVHVRESPVVLAAAAVYAAPLFCDEDLTQSEVSDVADVSEVTIRNRYRELLDAADPVPA